MGHDIYGYQTITDRDNEINEIAYMNRSGFNPLNTEIYIALNATEFNNGVSGNDKSKIFTKDELLKALSYLNSKIKLDLNREITFINECIENINIENTIIIHFS